MKRIYFYFIVSTIFFPTLAMSAFGAQKIPQWQREMNERAKEMEALQQQNGTGNEQLVKNDFPATYADLPFLQRIKMESEDISKYKNLKTYRDLDIKTAAQWCGDTKNQTSPECIKYFCSPGGPKANTTGCISWRCDEKAYYKAHKEECETNKLCSDGKESSDACMDYRCHQTSDKDSAKCTDWLCRNDSVYNSVHRETCACQIEGESSYACMEYKCNQTTDQYLDRCKSWKCDNDPAYQQENRAVCDKLGTSTESTQSNNQDNVYTDEEGRKTFKI